MSGEHASLIGRTLHIIRRRGAALLGVSAWPFALSFTVLMILALGVAASGGTWDPIQIWKNMSWLTRCNWILSYIAYFFLSPLLALAGICQIVSADQTGSELSFADASFGVARDFGRLVAFSIALGFSATIGFEIFVLPGLALLALTTFAVPVIMLERKGMRSAWRRSASLVRQRRGSVIALGGGLLATVVTIFIVVSGFQRVDSATGKLITRLFLVLLPPPIAMFFGTMNTLLFLDITKHESVPARAASA